MRDVRAELLLVAILALLFFSLPSSLPTPSSLLKLPINLAQVLAGSPKLFPLLK